MHILWVLSSSVKGGGLDYVLQVTELVLALLYTSKSGPSTNNVGYYVLSARDLPYQVSVCVQRTEIAFFILQMFYKSPRQKNQYGICDPHTHAGSITCVKVDRYHIASGSTDGYALIWSALGDCTKCINALRHPK